MSTPEPPRVDPVRLDQYKLYMADLTSIGTRYTTANGFYVSVITALLAILALAKPGGGMDELGLLLRLVVPFFAVCLCVLWSNTIAFYGALFSAKFDTLRKMEEHLPFPTFATEYEALDKRKTSWLLQNERRVPLMLALPFLAIFLQAAWKLFIDRSMGW